MMRFLRRLFRRRCKDVPGSAKPSEGANGKRRRPAPTAPERTILVSVLCDTWDPIPHLKDRGFHSLQMLPGDLRAELEITGGYLSYMRGDYKGHGRAASVFFINRRYVASLRLSTIVRREQTVVAVGTYRCKRYGQTRPVLYIIGPESEVHATIEEELLGLQELHSTRTDLEIALLWWGGEVRYK